MKEHQLTGIIRTRLKAQGVQLEKTLENARRRYSERVSGILEDLPERVIRELRDTGDIPGKDLAEVPEGLSPDPFAGEEG